MKRHCFQRWKIRCATWKAGDAKTVKTLGETGGLGTVATRADIIDKLFHSFLMEKRGKEIFITSKGRQLFKIGSGRFEKTGIDG